MGMTREYEELLQEQGRIAVIASRLAYNAALEDAAELAENNGEWRLAEEIRALRKEAHVKTKERPSTMEGTAL